MIDFNSVISEVSKKYNYSEELSDALKRCIPAMVVGKSDEDIQLLMDTLDRVQIFTFDSPPTDEEIDDVIMKQKLMGRNDHVKSIDMDCGDYGKNAQGTYQSEMVFDEHMNIIDRIGIIWLVNLSEESPTRAFYGTRINLSNLIHELGHAWGAQKGEVQQEENGNYTVFVGAGQIHFEVDRDECIVEEIERRGVFVEEALNSIEEENSLYRLFNIDSFFEIPGYVASGYQGGMTTVMKKYIDELGPDLFDRLRFQKDRAAIQGTLTELSSTDFMQEMQVSDYYILKENALRSFEDTDMSDDAKKAVCDMLESQKSLFLYSGYDKNFIDHLDMVLEQLFYLDTVREKFDLGNEEMRQAWMSALVAVMREGLLPLQDMLENKKVNNNPVLFSPANIGEKVIKTVTSVPLNEEKMDSDSTMEETVQE